MDTSYHIPGIRYLVYLYMIHGVCDARVVRDSSGLYSCCLHISCTEPDARWSKPAFRSI